MNNLIEVKNTMTSIEIAEITEKNHADVLRDIRDESEKLGVERGQSIFAESSYVNSQNKKQPMYVLTIEGVIQLAARYDAVVRYQLIQKVTGQAKKKPLSKAEQLLQQAQLIVEHESRLNELEKGMSRVENNVRRTITSNHLTIIAYANMKGIKPTEYSSSALGRKATKICKDENLQIGKVVDSRYGLINTYPEDVLDKIFF